jgi:hypothetical protein
LTDPGECEIDPVEFPTEGGDDFAFSSRHDELVTIDLKCATISLRHSGIEVQFTVVQEALLVVWLRLQHWRECSQRWGRPRKASRLDVLEAISYE